MKTIAVLTDSSADLSVAEAKRLGINIIRMPLIVDETQYLEEVEIDLETFIAKMRAGSDVKTSSPILGDLFAKWEELLKTHDEVIYIPISSGLSSSFNTALAVSKNYDGKVVVIDAKFVCYPLTMLCLDVLDMISKGYSGVEIKTIVEKDAELWACLMPYNLNALMKGGRISPAVAALGNLLKIVPLLKVENGAIDIQDKVRTHKKAYDKAIKICTDVENFDDYRFLVVDGDCMKESLEVAKKLEKIVNAPVEIHKMRAVIMSHTGPSTVACGRVKKLKY